MTPKSYKMFPPSLFRPVRCQNWLNNWLHLWDECRWEQSAVVVACGELSDVTLHRVSGHYFNHFSVVRSVRSASPKCLQMPSWRRTRSPTWTSSNPIWWTWSLPGPTAPHLLKSAKWQTSSKVSRWCSGQSRSSETDSSLVKNVCVFTLIWYKNLIKQTLRYDDQLWDIWEVSAHGLVSWTHLLKQIEPLCW